MRLRIARFVLLPAVLVLGGCGATDLIVQAEPTPPDQGGYAPAPDDAGTDAVTGVPGELPRVIDLDGATARAVELLAVTRQVDPAAIGVVSAEAVTWPDSSLGCPRPNERYTKALIDGYRIVLELNGEQIAFHGADGARPFPCEPSDGLS